VQNIQARLLIALPVAALIALGAQPALAPAAATRVYLASCGGAYGGKVKPKTWDYGCTETNDIIDAKWTGWGSATAHASARTQLDDCMPSCAEGKTIEPLAQAKISRIRTCVGAGGHRHRYYTRVSITYRLDAPFGDLPAGERTVRYSQHCGR